MLRESGLASGLVAGLAAEAGAADCAEACVAAGWSAAKLPRAVNVIARPAPKPAPSAATRLIPIPLLFSFVRPKTKTGRQKAVCLSAVTRHSLFHSPWNGNHRGRPCRPCP